MAHHREHRRPSIAGKNFSYSVRSKHAEDHTAASVTMNRNQKGHTPNSPSTG